MLFLSALLACGPACFSQQAEKFPLGDYVELTDTKPHDGEEVWSKMTAPVRFCWGTTDVRYKKLNVPDVKATGTLRLKAWKGERVNAQAVLWTQKELEGAEIAVSELKNGSSVIPASAAPGISAVCRENSAFSCASWLSSSARSSGSMVVP